MSTHISNGAPTTGEGSLPPSLSRLYVYFWIYKYSVCSFLDYLLPIILIYFFRNCLKYYEEYDSSSVAFNPAVPPPNRKGIKKSLKISKLNSEFINKCNKALDEVPKNISFSKLYK